MDDGAIYHKEKDREKKMEFLRTMREIWEEWNQGPILAILGSKNLTDFLNHLVSLDNSIKMAKTEFPLPRIHKSSRG